MARRLLLLSGLAMLSVILFHGAGWGLTGMLAWAPRYLAGGLTLAEARTSPAYAVFRLIEQATVFAIPAFLLVSGFFVAFSTPRGRSAPEWRPLLTRLVWLVAPYLVWTLLVWIGMALQGIRSTPAEYGRMLFTGSTTPAYYYIPVLVQLYLLSPFLVRWAKAHAWSLVAFAGLVQLAFALAPLTVLTPESGALRLMAAFPKWIFLPHLPWFALGILIGLYLPSLRSRLMRWRYVSLAAAAGFFVVGIVEWEWIVGKAGGAWVDHRATVVDSLYALAILLAFVGLAEAGLPRQPRLEAVGAQSYGIYLAHPPAMEAFARGVYHFAPRLLAFPVLFALLVMAVGLGLPLALMAVFRRNPFRPAYRYLFG